MRARACVCYVWCMYVCVGDGCIYQKASNLATLYQDVDSGLTGISIMEAIFARSV